MDGKAVAGDHRGDAVDQKGHVVVDDAEAHHPAAGLTPHRLKPDRDLARFAGRGDLGDELGGLVALGIGETQGLAGQSAAHQRLAQG